MVEYVCSLNRYAMWKRHHDVMPIGKNTTGHKWHNTTFCACNIFPHTMMFSNFLPMVLQWENDCMINTCNCSHINSQEHINIWSCSQLLHDYHLDCMINICNCSCIDS